MINKNGSFTESLQSKQSIKPQTSTPIWEFYENGRLEKRQSKERWVCGTQDKYEGERWGGEYTGVLGSVYSSHLYQHSDYSFKKKSYLVTPTIITYGSFQPSHSSHVSGVRQSSRVFARAFAFVLVATVATAAAAVEVVTLILNSSRCINPELMTKSILLLLSSLWRWWWVERIMGWRGDGRFALYRCKRRGWYERVDREEVPGRRRETLNE